MRLCCFECEELGGGTGLISFSGNSSLMREWMSEWEGSREEDGVLLFGVECI